MRLLGLLGLLAVGVACSDPTGFGGGRSQTITVGNNFYSPNPDTASAGLVTFTWATPSVGHDVIWDNGPGTLPTNSSILMSGTYQVTLQAGTYNFHCSVHGAGAMSGRVVVQ